MADHTVTNHGKRAIKVFDSRDGVHMVQPGASVTVDLRSIYHGDGPANYTVEVAEPIQRKPIR